MLPSLMIINDDPLVDERLIPALINCFRIFRASSPDKAIKFLCSLPNPPQLLLINLSAASVAGSSGDDVQRIARLRTHCPDARVFVLPGRNEQRNVHAHGIAELIPASCTPEKIRKLLSEALSARASKDREADQCEELFGIAGTSSAIQTLRSQIAMYAPMPFPVLIEGESGCGKELIANAIQKAGTRPQGPYKVLNCAALSPTLIEATLFGHGKGAYTGAVGMRAGFFEDASDGTLFLDEIGELPLELQTKLLRVLENGEYQRVGETATRKSNARIIAATNRDLRNAVKTGTFRNDLYYRLNVYSIRVPPLRELGNDKLILLNYFREYFVRQTGQATFELQHDARQLWEHYSFPGNTRELRNIVIRLNTKYPGQRVSRAQLQDEFDTSEAEASLREFTVFESIKLQLQQGRFRLDQHLHEQECCYIQAALGLASGNVSAAARLLGINRTTLHSRMDTHENLDFRRSV